MKKLGISIVAAIMMTTSLQALDVRLVTGIIIPNNVHLEDSTLLGLEIAEYTNIRGNGLSYGARFGFASTDLSTDGGAYANLSFDIVYRLKRHFEPYFTGGVVLQNLSESNYGYGYAYGGGMRYSSCKGFQFGVEFNIQDMTFKSGSVANNTFNGDSYTNNNLIVYTGYRF